ncbi:MAG: GIY-YIG nuclease family protein, partial [Planctomycetes bacterium]|nr:GIY-YIG nuclease family protein [Planctomycetota bacterium]
MTDVPPPFEVGYVYLVQTSDLYKLGKTKNLANRVSQYRSGYPRAKCLFAREVLLHEMLSAEQALLAAANVAGLKKLHGRREWYEEPIPKELFLEVAEPYHRRFKDAYDLYTGVDLSRLFLDPGMAISAFAFIRELSQLGNDRSWDNRSKALALVLVYLSFAQLDRLVHERIALMPKWQKLELEETLRDFAQSFEVLYYGSRVAHLAFFRAFYRHWDRYTRDDIARYYVNIAFETVVTRNQELLSQAEEVYSFMAELDPEFFPLEELRTGSYYPYTSFTEVLEA